jgi:hypothetical protein
MLGNADSNCEGNTGRGLAQGESPATIPDPRFPPGIGGGRVTMNQVRGRQSRPRGESPEARWEAIGRLKRRGYRPCHYGGLYPQSQRKGTPSGHPDHVGQSHAGVVSAGAGTGVRRDERSELLWVRINRSTADAMSQLFVNLSRKASAQWILEADIKGVSTISVTTGWSAMSLWTKQSFGSG